MTEQEYILHEKKRMTFLQKIMKKELFIYNTTYLQNKDYVQNLGKKTILRTSKSIKILFFIFLLLELYFATMFIYLVFQNILTPIVLLLSLILGFILYKTGLLLFGKKYNYVIEISSQYLKIGTHKFEWNIISETLIQVEGLRHGSENRIVVLTKSGGMFNFSLFNFKISDSKLSYIIEYYKRRKNAATSANHAMFRCASHGG